MDAKPEWVPEWIWAEYLDFRRWETPRPDENDVLARMYRRMDTLMAARECAALWRAVENRRDTLESRPTLMGLGAGFRVCAMLFEIAANAEGIPPEEALSATERKKLGKVIAKRARDLRGALKDMARSGTPAAFNGPLDDFANQYSKSYVPHKSLEGMLSGAEQSPEITAACMAGYRDAVGALAMDDFADMLEAFERAGMALSNSAPPIAQLASLRAARLHFVRETTKDMRFHFGQPLREAVAALANVLFPSGPDGGLDAATVAKLAR